LRVPDPLSKEASMEQTSVGTGRLIGIPSYHFEPHFAIQAAEAVAREEPAAVALELPEGLRPELEWAARCWPVPVAAVAGRTCFPFVPGDSIFEAYRLARAAGIPVRLIDLDCAGGGERPSLPLPAPELCGREPALCEEIGSRVHGAADVAGRENSAREAFMARRLVALLGEHPSVLWVGGAAHWPQLRERLAARDYSAPRVRRARRRIFQRVRLDGPALHWMTGRTTYLARRFAADPSAYDEGEGIRALVVDALSAANGDPGGAPPAELVRLLLYARNLAASRALRELPDLGELLTAAFGTCGARAADRILAAALGELDSPATAALPVLSLARKRVLPGLALGGRHVRLRSYHSPRPGAEVDIRELVETTGRSADPLFGGGSSSRRRQGETEVQRGWASDPREDTAYRAYLACILRLGSAPPETERRSLPFSAGMQDGLDVGMTLRHWREDRIYVREQAPARAEVRHAIVDYGGEYEGCPLHQGLDDDGSRAGWTDPSFTEVGSCSRETSATESLQEKPYHVGLRRRDFSMVTLARPNYLHPHGRGSFYDRVIYPLVVLEAGNDNLYGWLEVMFEFCRGQRVAYFSRYVPGARVREVAARHRVKLLALPLERIPEEERERHRRFHFLYLERQQCVEFRRRCATARQDWTRGKARTW
jgi:hypothetical protein